MVHHASEGNAEARTYTTDVKVLDKNTIQVLSATVKDKVIEGAEVIFQRGGETSLKSVSNASGLAAVPDNFMDDNGSLVIIKKEGYSNLVSKCPCRGLTYAISPHLKNLDGVRVVLNWGASPRDLDLHVRYNENHVYYSNMRESNVNLDVDDTDSYGPETITLDKKEYGTQYAFFVHDYTNQSNPDGRSLSSSSAQVFVYIGSSLIKSFTVPVGVNGNVWKVFDLSPEGEIVVHNKMFKTTAPTEDILNGNNYEESHFSPAAALSDKDEAKRLNTLGETAYHAGNMDEAIDHYLAAIDLYNDFGQAYSNLGLAYYKNGNKAEALWANRKAIALANGATANVTKANSYYNIAKIYEDDGEFEEALRNYRKANENNPRDAYDKAIARVQEKAG